MTTTVTALQALIDEGGIDPAPYFDIAADDLLARHGEDALDLSASALRQSREDGDHEGVELWELIRVAIARRLDAFAQPAPVFH